MTEAPHPPLQLPQILPFESPISLDAPLEPSSIAVAGDPSPVVAKMLARFKMAHSKTSPASFHNCYVLSEHGRRLFHLG